MSDLSRFDDSTVLVTGATRGIGAVIAGRFAKEGASVVLAGRTGTDGRRVARDIKTDGGEARFVRTDLREPNDIENLVATAADEHGIIDVVVNNAAVQTNTAVHEASMEDWERVIETDFRAYWLCAKEARSYMEEGCIVNVSSNHAFRTMPSIFPYNAVKAGINGMTRAMAIDFGPDVRVNTVNPGWIAVDRTLANLSDDELTQLESIHPVGRIGEPEDVAGVATYLASDDAAFLTGASILVDGGRGAALQDDTLPDYRRQT